MLTVTVYSCFTNGQELQLYFNFHSNKIDNRLLKNIQIIAHKIVLMNIWQFQFGHGEGLHSSMKFTHEQVSKMQSSMFISLICVCVFVRVRTELHDSHAGVWSIYSNESRLTSAGFPLKLRFSVSGQPYCCRCLVFDIFKEGLL